MPNAIRWPLSSMPARCQFLAVNCLIAHRLEFESPLDRVPRRPSQLRFRGNNLPPVAASEV